MIIRKQFLRTLTIAFVSLVVAASTQAMTPKSLADKAQGAHNLESWWGKEVVSADVEILFGGKPVVGGTFTFEAHGPRARYDRADGVSIIFDGKTAWATPAESSTPKGRFHVLTWPWFIMAPFKIQGDGIQLSDVQENVVDGNYYYSVLQTFGADMGDTPDDWYRFYIDSETKQVEAMSYIVTYGKDDEPAKIAPSIIKYLDYVDAEGPLISTRYELWYWDADTHSYVGDTPKATGTVSNIRYMTVAEADFTVPSDARELPLK
ncbi:MAG: hypothetical protein ACSHYA_05755 [Opitutaceae bacterium]